MGNCFVTKLKGTVDADLPRFGMLRVYQYSSEEYSLTPSVLVAMAENVDATISGGQFVSAEGTPLGTTFHLNAGVSYNLRASQGDCIMYIPKYAIQSLYVPSAQYYVRMEDCSKFGAASANPLQFSVKSANKFNGDISVLDGMTFGTIELSGAGFSGDISNITGKVIIFVSPFTGKLKVLPTTTTLDIRATHHVTVDYQDLIDCTFGFFNLRGVYGGGDIGLLNFTNTLNSIDLPRGSYGSVESMIEKLWANGKRNGNILFSCYAGASPTLNGNNMRSISMDFNIEFSANEAKIRSHFAQNYLATYNGSTWTYTE